MADDDFESFDNLDDLDWSDVEEELKQNREQILTAATGEDEEVDMSSIAATISEDEISDEEPVGEGNLDINFLLDVQLKISVEVGRAEMFISDLLKLDSGKVVELRSSVGQPLDIRVNDKLVARGEVVVINEKFGVRITEIVSPDDRFSVLQ